MKELKLLSLVDASIPTTSGKGSNRYRAVPLGFVGMASPTVAKRDEA